MTLLFAAIAATGFAAATFEDGRLEPVFLCALAWFARYHWIAVSDGEFLAGVAALFLACAFLDSRHWAFHVASGVLVTLSATLVAGLV